MANVRSLTLAPNCGMNFQIIPVRNFKDLTTFKSKLKKLLFTTVFCRFYYITFEVVKRFELKDAALYRFNYYSYYYLHALSNKATFKVARMLQVIKVQWNLDLTNLYLTKSSI